MLIPTWEYSLLIRGLSSLILAFVMSVNQLQVLLLCLRDWEQLVTRRSQTQCIAPIKCGIGDITPVYCQHASVVFGCLLACRSKTLAINVSKLPQMNDNGNNSNKYSLVECIQQHIYSCATGVHHLQDQNDVITRHNLRNIERDRRRPQCHIRLTNIV